MDGWIWLSKGIKENLSVERIHRKKNKQAYTELYIKHGFAEGRGLYQSSQTEHHNYASRQGR